KEIAKLIDEYDIIGIVQMENLGVRQLQNIKKKLKGKALIKMAKNSIMKRAISQSKKPGIEKLSDWIQGSCAFIFSKLSGFKLFQFLKENKSKAFAKPGQIAPDDIVIPEGNTGFQPGPMITELNELGLKTKIVKGSIWIAEDTVVVKAGEEIPRKITVLLSKLNIQPMRVGLDLTAIYEDGQIFTKDVLDIDVDEIKAQIQQAYLEALNLSVNAVYPTKDNITQLIAVAAQKATNLVHNADILLPETVGNILAKAKLQAESLYQKIKEKNPEI
ncbi:MAG: 50S ribosomal protein L10, partial [Candidatus Odinarchaeia archaeon]